MELPKHLTAKLKRVAEKSGRDATEVLETALDNQLAYEEWKLKAIDEGLADSELGRVITHDELLEKLERQRLRRARREKTA